MLPEKSMIYTKNETDKNDMCTEEKDFFSAYESLLNFLIKNPNQGFSEFGNTLAQVMVHRNAIESLAMEISNTVIDLDEACRKLVYLSINIAGHKVPHVSSMDDILNHSKD
jgi:hypothetical protein